MQVLHLVLALTVALAAPADRFQRAANTLIAAINASDIPAIERLFNADMQKAVPEDQAREFFPRLITSKGKLKKARIVRIEDDTTTLRFIAERGEWDSQLSLDASERISGLYFLEPRPPIPVPARNTMPLRLPFEGEWYVVWGGATREQNQHIDAENQKRALDLYIEDSKGRSCRGNGQRNTDYYAYGMTIFSPAAGTVVTVIAGVPDNIPGSMNPYSALGNCVILRMAPRQYAVLAHLQPGSARVRVGQRVGPGQALGRCGNSGNSSEPHLHFHLQNTQTIQDGTGFAPYFRNVRVSRDGKTRVEKDYTPVRGDRLKAAR